MSAGRRVLVLGGAQGMGRWFIEHVFDLEAELAIAIADTSDEVQAAAHELREQTGLEITGHQLSFDGGVLGLPDLSQCQIVVIAVPLKQIETVATTVIPELTPGTFVFDVASLKEQPLEQIVKHAPDGISVLGTHPVFGVKVTSLEGQGVVLCETPETRPEDKTWLTELLSSRGALIVESSAAKHDEYMSVVQALTHFVFFTLGKALGELEVDLGQAFEYQTPPFRALASFLGRMLELAERGEADLYAGIQAGATRPEVREAFRRAASDLEQVIDRGQESEIADEIKAIGRQFPGEVLEYAVSASQEAIRAEQEVDRQLGEHKRAGSPAAFRDADTGDVTVGLIKEISRRDVTVDECVVWDDSGQAALTYDEQSATSAEALGFDLEKPRQGQTLSRSRVSLLSGSEFANWRDENLKHHEVELSVEIGEELEGAALARALHALTPDVLSCVVKDLYHRDADHKELVLATVILGERDPTPVLRQLRTLAEEFGARAPSAR